MALVASLLILAIVGAGGALYVLHRYGTDLPDYRHLADYQPPTVTRIHAADGRLMAEYAHEKRIFVPIEAIPKRLIQAFLSAEDKNFYRHPGIDPLGILRAVLTNLRHLADDRRPVGASTITQQVAKNFLLSNEVSLQRKIKEAILAFRIEQAFSKDQILELYLNQIYLGVGSYGVAAAALNYFDKSLDELTIAEAAFLAGLPKAPSWYHPVRQPEAAKARRDWVIGRMLDVGFISAEDAALAAAEPLVMQRRAPTEIVTAEYFTEEVRRELVEAHGEDFLYQGGLSIRTTMAPEPPGDGRPCAARRADRPTIAATAGAVPRPGCASTEDWPGQLIELDHSNGIERWQLAVVLEVAADGARARPRGRQPGRRCRSTELTWARAALEDGRRPRDHRGRPGGPAGRRDLGRGPRGRAGRAVPRYALRQPPEVEGAVVALDPHTGRVLAMTGGFSFRRSVFNRATQALAPARLGAQAVRLSRRPRERAHAVQHPARRADRGRSGPGPRQVEAGQLLRPLLRPEHAPARHREVAQPDDRAPRPDDRHGPRGRHGAPLRHRRRHGAQSGLGARAPARSTCSSLTSAYATPRQRRQAARAGADRAHPGPPRPHRAAARRPALPRLRRRRLGGQPTPALVDQREQVIPAARAYQMVNLLQGVVERGTGVRARVARQAGRRQDRHLERQPRRLVHRLHARPRGRRLRRLRPAEEPRRQASRAPRPRCRCSST